MEHLDLPVKELIKAAMEAKKKAYTPYSGYQVGAALLTNELRIYTGCNIENASYGATICAERVAIDTAIASGYTKGDFSRLYVMCDSEKVSSCCFICRQVIGEFFSTDSEVTLYSNDGDKEVYTVKELCPYPFGSEDLKN